jgi:hypothetical protein
MGLRLRPRMTTLQNQFHRKLYQTSKSREEIDRIIYRIQSGRADAVDRRWVRRVRGVLCGIDDCKCATSEIGERGI